MHNPGINQDRVYVDPEQTLFDISTVVASTGSVFSPVVESATPFDDFGSVSVYMQALNPSIAQSEHVSVAMPFDVNCCEGVPQVYRFSGSITVVGTSLLNAVPFVGRLSGTSLSTTLNVANQNDMDGIFIVPHNSTYSDNESSRCYSHSNWNCTLTVGALLPGTTENTESPLLFGVAMTNYSSTSMNGGITGSMSALRSEKLHPEWEVGRV